MSAQCPYCSSSNTQLSETDNATATCIGAVGGMATAIYRAVTLTSKFSSVGFTAAAITGLVLNGLAGGVMGATLGSQIGREFSGKFTPLYFCKSCKTQFTASAQLIRDV